MTSPAEVRTWHVISNRWNSAVTEYALSCAQACRQLGWQSVISPLKGSPCERRAREAQLETRAFKGFGPAALAKFLLTFRSVSPTHIFVYGGQETTLALCLPAGPRVIRFRGQDQDMKRLPSPLARKVAESRLDALLFPNEALAERFRPGASIPTAAVTLGCDANRFQARGLWKDQASHEILCVGRFDPVKGHQRLFHIFSLAKNIAEQSMMLRIIGEPANISVQELRAMAAAKGLVESKDYVLQNERVPNLAHFMERAAVGVIPSLDSEVICRVGEEFLLCGTPLCVSGAGALDELLFAGAGLSYAGKEDHDAAGLLALVFDRSIQESAETRKARALQARQRFSLEAMATSLSAYLSQLV